MAITRYQTVAAIHEGFRTANRSYQKWSHGLGVTDSGVEGLIASYISEAIHKRQEQHEALYMEMQFSEICKRSGRRPPRTGRRRRADIVLCNRSSRPTGVIEVKRKWNARQCMDDVLRIQQLLRACSHVNGGSLRRGYLALMIAKKPTNTKSAPERVREQQSKIEEAIRRVRRDEFNRTYSLSRFANFGTSTCASLIVEIVTPNQEHNNG